MILRCTAPRKNDHLRPCGHWLAAVPDGSRVLRTVRHSSEADPWHTVVGCGGCNTLYEIAPPLPKVA